MNTTTPRPSVTPAIRSNRTPPLAERREPSGLTRNRTPPLAERREPSGLTVPRGEGEGGPLFPDRRFRCSINLLATSCCLIVLLAVAPQAPAQSPTAESPDSRSPDARPPETGLPELRTGDAVPREVRQMYTRGLEFLAESQTDAGDWDTDHRGAGVTGLAVLSFLASGEDPNFGRYAEPIRLALQNIIRQQDPKTGYFGGSMYHHGFATLALAEAYGVVDDSRFWDGDEAERLSLAESLEMAVRGALTSQKANPHGAWRYSPSGSEADTSVAGAMLMGLLAARNAGLEVPDEAIDRAIGYFVKMTAASGQVAYSGGIGGFDESLARISIATLVYAIARRQELPQYDATLGYLTDRVRSNAGSQGGAHYQNYYQAQALFQGDYDAWKRWNEDLIRQLQAAQLDDGSFRGSQDAYVSTTLSLLSLAVNFRFLPIYER